MKKPPHFMTGAALREAFLAFFKDHQHQVVPSVPLVLENDPSLLFVNAGMVPFKDYFMGTRQPPFARATSSQKCVRAGGKHNDLEQVGYTKRHHTFFEMLGNFSFGDYFKEEAIVYAFDFLTKVLRLPKERLYITYYHTDEETQKIWKRVSGFGDDHILPIATSDNFWSMGAEGPCGPCTEIFYDHGDHLPGGLPGTPEEDGDRFVEVWNLVFMQFHQAADGTQTPLPKACVDTGSGLERLAAVMQGVDDNYATDLFKPLIDKAAQLLDLPAQRVSERGVSSSLKVLADHTRAASFLMADGVLPSAEGRGYVLRRMVRRGLLHARKLGATKPLMAGLVPQVVSVMGQAYPDLGKAQTLIQQTLFAEEEGFADILLKGEALLEERIAKKQVVKGANKVFSGAEAFQLYDTHGLPKDVIVDLLAARGLTIDEKVFDQELEKQRTRARGASKFKAKVGEIGDELFVPTDAQQTRFLGYESLQAEGILLAIIKDGARAEDVRASNGPGLEKASESEVWLLFDQTPFYGESGGQEGDRGCITDLKGSLVNAEVLDTQKRTGFLWHRAVLEKGALKVGQVYNLQVDEARRQGLKAHHSATHLLHAALRKRLGDHVVQKGSLVANDRLRFDFSHPKRLSSDDLVAISHQVNREIRKAQPVRTQEMPLEKAKELGAMALFGEAYDEHVRVVTMNSQEVAQDWPDPFSIELCGGTHVANTGEIGLFHIVSESGVSKGIRRIEAVAGEAAEKWMVNLEARYGEAKNLLKTSDENFVEKVKGLLKKGPSAGPKTPMQDKENQTYPLLSVDWEGGKAILQDVGDMPTGQMHGLMDNVLKKEASDAARGILCVLVSAQGTKTTLLVGVKAAQISAADVVKHLLQPMHGRGGGRKDRAQGGFEGPISLEKLKGVLLDFLQKNPS